MRFTKRTGISTPKNPQYIREIWKEILSLLRSSIPEITMIHLDSLIWQISSLSDDELEIYFGSFGIEDVGRDLLPFLQNDPLVFKEISQLQMNENNKVSVNSQSEGKKILILFPCSKRKNSYVDKETFEENEEKQSIEYIKNARNLLVSGREGMSSYINPNSKALSALDRYNGYLYNSTPDFRNSIKEACSKDNVHILIISGAFGIVTPSESIGL